MHIDVVNWFIKSSKNLETQYGLHVPSLAFVHIPTSAMLKFQKQGVDEHQEPGLNDDIPLGSQGPNDKPFVKALMDTEGLLAVFSGHDHGNDFCHPTNGPFFCFGRHTGYGGYGHWMRGSRQVVLNRAAVSGGKGVIETWIRLEDGTTSGHVFLNDTFGTDVYPTVEHKWTTLPPPEP